MKGKRHTWDVRIRTRVLHLTEANVPGIRSVESKTFCHLNDPEHVRRVQMLTGSDRQRRFWRCYKMELKQAASQPLPSVGQVCVTVSVHVDTVTRIGASPNLVLNGVTVHIWRERKRGEKGEEEFLNQDREPERATLPIVAVTHFHIVLFCE